MRNIYTMKLVLLNFLFFLKNKSVRELSIILEKEKTQNEQRQHSNKDL